MSLMPAVDIVLYVVSPQKYRDDIGWRIVVKERGRRAFAFVLNKWDQRIKSTSQAPGKDIDQDFRELIETGGYSDPLLFRVSAKRWVERFARPENEVEIPEGDQFAALRDWLSHGLTTSKVEIIQRRRRRALWGDLAEQISKSIPQVSRENRWPRETLAALAELQGEGIQAIRTHVRKAARDLSLAVDDRRWPTSPGILGLYLGAVSALRFLVETTVHLRRPLALWNHAQRFSDKSLGDGNGNAGAAINAQLLVKAHERVLSIETFARETRFPADWALSRIQQNLSTLPARIESCLDRALTEAREKSRQSIRYRAGIFLLATFEMVIALFMMVAVWRLGTGFFTGNYVPFAFAANAFALLVGLLVCGHIIVNCCFPRPEIMVADVVRGELEASWNSWVDDLERTVTEFISQIEKETALGQRHSQEIDRELQMCQAPMPPLGERSGYDVEQLF